MPRQRTRRGDWTLVRVGGEAHAPSIAGVLVLLGLFFPAMSIDADDVTGRFRYDEHLGKCVNARGEEGFNPLPPGRPGISRDSECVDFAGQILMYVSARGANVRGARFDGARFEYLNDMTGADLSGARDATE